MAVIARARTRLRKIRRKTRRKVRTRVRSYSVLLFNSRLLSRVRKRRHVLCLGDSHVMILHRVKAPGVWFSIEGIAGATASGVLNPNSQTRAATIFMDRLQRAKPWQQVVVQMGEVDCGFVIWQRAERDGIGVEEQLRSTLDSYASFLEDIVAMGFARVFVMSAPLPTISDFASEWVGPVASARKDVRASKAERTSLTMRFNEQLAARCQRLGVTFVDVTTAQFDEAMGLIDPRFLRATNLDHHLAPLPYAELIRDELVPLLNEPSPP